MTGLTGTVDDTARTALAHLLDEDLADWGSSGAAAVVSAQGVEAASGHLRAPLPWASVTKIVSALAVLDVVHDGALDLDEPAGPPGSTVRHLLGHASGLAFGDDRVLAEPGVRRIYSNTGIDVAVAHAVARSGARDAADLLEQRVLRPLGMASTRLAGPAAHGMVGPVRDLALLALELLQPHVLPLAVVEEAVSPSFPGLAGVLPGFGRQDPNDWGLGIELRGAKRPHWMPPGATSNAFGHFGQAGSFLWVDRALGVGAVALTGRPFGPWAVEAWPRSSQRWLEAWLHDGPRRATDDGGAR
jgi:CubicO group peptidase (beta-lactamase class C family)